LFFDWLVGLVGWMGGWLAGLVDDDIFDDTFRFLDEQDPDPYPLRTPNVANRQKSKEMSYVVLHSPILSANCMSL
jgi:hypothetical protein